MIIFCRCHTYADHENASHCCPDNSCCTTDSHYGNAYDCQAHDHQAHYCTADRGANNGAADYRWTGPN
jgi:hypothetical protein